MRPELVSGILLAALWIMMGVRVLASGSNSIEALQQFGISVIVGMLAFFVIFM